MTDDSADDRTVIDAHAQASSLECLESLVADPDDNDRMSLDGVNPGSDGEVQEAEQILLGEHKNLIEAADENERLRRELSESDSHASSDDNGDGGMAEANVVEGADDVPENILKQNPMQRALDQDQNLASTQVMSRQSSLYSSAAAAGRSREPSEHQRDPIMLHLCPSCGARGSDKFPLSAMCELGCNRRYHQHCQKLFPLGAKSACLRCAFFTHTNPHAALVFCENDSGPSISLHKEITCSTCSESHQGVICSACNRAMCSSCHVLGTAVPNEKFEKKKNKITTPCPTQVVCFFCNGPDKHRLSLDARVLWMISEIEVGRDTPKLRADIEQSLADLVALSRHDLTKSLMLAAVKCFQDKTFFRSLSHILT